MEKTNNEIPAYFGGKPIREDDLYYGRQWIEQEDVEVVSDVLLSKYITCGPMVDALERKLSAYTGAKYTVIVSNGTAALHCACISAGIGPGDEVITTPITFAASANCILYCGGRPVFADINPTTFNIDPKSIEEKITDRTKAIIAVDFTGQVVDIDEIRRICQDRNLVFIEDAAHSIGTRYKGNMVGSLADMTTFSFHPVKTITGGEGGAIQTNSRELYEKLMLSRTHGIIHNLKAMDDGENHTGEPWWYEQVSLGFNYRLTDFQAALIGNQLNRIEQFVKRRKSIVSYYNSQFENIQEIKLQKTIKESDTCNHLYTIRINREEATFGRKEFFNALEAEKVHPQVHYIPVYYFPYYKKLGYSKGICPNAEELYEEIISLPLYPRMTDKDVDDVVSAVKKIIFYYRNR